MIREGFKKSDNIFSIYLDIRPFFEHFLKKMFLPQEKLKTIKKFAKNKVKGVEVAVLAAMSGVLAAPYGTSATQRKK